MTGEALPPELTRIFAGLGPVAVALSGGLDSRFLCHALALAGQDLLALHAAGPHVPPSESAWARQWAAGARVPLLEIRFSPLDDAAAAANGRDRCYHCKRALIAALRRGLEASGQAGRSLCDGSNADDQGRYRPGLRALREAGVLSPLALAGLGKNAIRQLAVRTGLARPDQRARPCLMTRFAYDSRPDAESMRRVAAAEAELETLARGDEAGLGDFRLRLLPAPCLQAERLTPGLAELARAILARHGFAGAALERRSPAGFFDEPGNAAPAHCMPQAPGL